MLMCLRRVDCYSFSLSLVGVNAESSLNYSPTEEAANRRLDTFSLVDRTSLFRCLFFIVDVVGVVTFLRCYCRLEK